MGEYQTIEQTTLENFERFMSQYRWLSKAASDDVAGARPSLTALHLTAFRDQPIAFATNGYRMHVQWGISGLFGRHAVLMPGSRSAIVPLPNTHPRAALGGIGNAELSLELTVNMPLLTVDRLAFLKNIGGYYDPEIDEDVFSINLAYEHRRKSISLGVDGDNIRMKVEGEETFDWKLLLNSRFLLDALNGFSSDRLVFRVNADKTMLAVGVPGERYATIMGMRMVDAISIDLSNDTNGAQS